MWHAIKTYVYAGAEFMNLPYGWEEWGEGRGFDYRSDIGVATTSFWSPAADICRRSWLLKEYLLPAFPDAPVFGKWDDRSLREFQHEVIQEPTEYFIDRLSSWRVTVGLPAPANRDEDADWVTAKPWQCFAARTVCLLLHTDAQGWIVPAKSQDRDGYSKKVADDLWSCRDDWTDDELHLARWLRPRTPEEFAKAARALSTSKDAWEWATAIQRRLVEKRWAEHRIERSVEHILGLT